MVQRRRKNRVRCGDQRLVRGPRPAVDMAKLVGPKQVRLTRQRLGASWPPPNIDRRAGSSKTPWFGRSRRRGSWRGRHAVECGDIDRCRVDRQVWISGRVPGNLRIRQPLQMNGPVAGVGRIDHHLRVAARQVERLRGNRRQLRFARCVGVAVEAFAYPATGSEMPKVRPLRRAGQCDRGVEWNRDRILCTLLDRSRSVRARCRRLAAVGDGNLVLSPSSRLGVRMIVRRIRVGARGGRRVAGTASQLREIDSVQNCRHRTNPPRA